MSAPLSAAEKKQRRQQANRLSQSSAAAPAAAVAAAATAAAKPALSLAEELAQAEAEAAAPAKAKGTKRKAAAAQLPQEAEEDEEEQADGEGAADEDDEEDEEEAEAGAFAWDEADDDGFGFGMSATPALASSGKTILPPSKQFQPFNPNTGTSLQHKINKQLAKKQKDNGAAAAGKKKAVELSDDEEGEGDEDMASSSEDDEDSEADSEEGDDDASDAADGAADATADVDMHAFKDDEVRRKVPAAAVASGPKVIAAKSIPRSANPIGDFAALKLSRPLLRAINDLGWAAPTPVQAASILPAVGGKDLLVNAVTGSGKTGAFMLPILERLLYRPKRVPLSRVLVLLPTRELAAQCLEVSQHLSKYTDIRICLVVGGLSEKVQEQELRNKPDIILATPGRLIDHLRNSANVHLEDIEILVLDEADRLLDCGFAEELREIIKETPKGRQTLLFSATLTENVIDLVNLSLQDPHRIKIDAYESIVDNLQQEFIRIRDGGASARRHLDDAGKSSRDKDSEREREAIILALCKRSFHNKTIIFMQSKLQCHRMSIIFGLAKLRAAELQGNMTQTQRLESLELFRSGQVDYLLCTDLASRGLDIPGVETVLNMSMPRELRQYIHRVGRTARAGRSGRAVTLVGEGQRAALKELVKKAKDVVHSRVVPPEVVQRYRALVREMEGDIRGVFDQEAEEKAARLAEMEANKLSNTMRFEEEIHARPAKTWFQTPAEKAKAKENAIRVFGEENDEEDEADEERAGKQGAAAEEPKKLSAKQLARAEAKLAQKKEKKKDSLLGLSRAKKRRKMMEIEARQAAAEAIAEAKKHAASMGSDGSDLRAQSLPKVVLPPSFEQQQAMQRVLGHKAKKERRAEQLASLGIADTKSKRREQQAVIQMKMDKKKGKAVYNDGSMEDVGGASSSKKKSGGAGASGTFRFQPREGSGDDRFKLPRRKAKEESAARKKSDAGTGGDSKKKGTKKATNSFKSKAKFKRRK